MSDPAGCLVSAHPRLVLTPLCPALRITGEQLLSTSHPEVPIMKLTFLGKDSTTDADDGLLEKLKDNEEEEDRSSNIQRCTTGVAPSGIPLVTRCHLSRLE